MAARRPASPRLTVLEAGMAHANAISALHGRSFDEPWSPFTVRQVLNMAGAFGLMAVAESREDDLCGFVLARAAAGECEILSLAAAPEWRGQGVGRILLDAAIARAAGLGVTSVFLEVAEDNLVAQALYRSRGFNAVGRRPGYYRRPREPAVAALTFGLTLTP